MTHLMQIALEQLESQGEDAEKLWAARIINGLRGCPGGLEPGQPRPHDWGPDDEIWEALFATTTEEQFEALERLGEEAEREADEDSLPMGEFLNRERVRRGDPPLPFPAESDGEEPGGDEPESEPAGTPFAEPVTSADSAAATVAGVAP